MNIIPEQEVIPEPESPINEIMEEPIEADNNIDTDEILKDIPPPEPPKDEEVVNTTNYITKEHTIVEEQSVKPKKKKKQLSEKQKNHLMMRIRKIALENKKKRKELKRTAKA